MLKRISTYWICQFAGWGLYAAITIFFYEKLSVKQIKQFYLLIFISIVLGLLMTHLMRMTIKKYEFLEKPIQRQIIFFVLTTIIFSIVYASIDVAIEKILNLSGYLDPKISLVNEIVRSSINSFFIFFIWNLLYYTYHYVEHNRKQRAGLYAGWELVFRLPIAAAD